MEDELMEKIVQEAAEQFKLVAKSHLVKSAKEDSPDQDSQGSSGPTDSDPDKGAEAPKADAPEGPPVAAKPEAPAHPDAAEDAGQHAAIDQGQKVAEETGAIMPAPTAEEICAEFIALPDDQFQLYVQAIEQAKALKMASAPVAPPMGAPPAGAAPMAPPPAPMDAMSPALKSEIEALKAANEQLKAENQNVIKQLNKAEEIFKSYIERDGSKVLRKSYTASSQVESAVVKKNYENLSKAEIDEMLRKKLRNGDLNKSQVDEFTAYAHGRKPLKDILHLLD